MWTYLSKLSSEIVLILNSNQRECMLSLLDAMKEVYWARRRIIIWNTIGLVCIPIALCGFLTVVPIISIWEKSIGSFFISVVIVVVMWVVKNRGDPRLVGTLKELRATLKRCEVAIALREFTKVDPLRGRKLMNHLEKLLGQPPEDLCESLMN